MALYWPKQKVALVFMDDPGDAPPPEVDDSWTVIPLSRRHVEDYAAYRRVMSRVADLLAAARADEPDDEAASGPSAQPDAGTLPQSA